MPYDLMNPQTGERVSNISNARVQEWLAAGWQVSGPTAAATQQQDFGVAPELAAYYTELDYALKAGALDIDQYNAGINELNARTSQYTARTNAALGYAQAAGSLFGPENTALYQETMRGSTGASGPQVMRAIQGVVPYNYAEMTGADLQPRNVRGFLGDLANGVRQDMGIQGGGGSGQPSVSVNGQAVAGPNSNFTDPNASGFVSPANKANAGIMLDPLTTPPVDWRMGQHVPSVADMGAPGAEDHDLTGYGYQRTGSDAIGNPRRNLQTQGLDPIDSEGNAIGPTWDAAGRPIGNGSTYWPRMPRNEMEAYYFDEWVKGGRQGKVAYDYPAPGESQADFEARTGQGQGGTMGQSAPQSAPAGQQAAPELKAGYVTPTNGASREFHYADGSVYREYADGRPPELTTPSRGTEAAPGMTPSQLGQYGTQPGYGPTMTPSQLGQYGSGPATGGRTGSPSDAQHSSSGRAIGGDPRNFGGQTGAHENAASRRAMGGLDPVVVDRPTALTHGGRDFVVGEQNRPELVLPTPNHLATYPLANPKVPVPPQAAQLANDLVPGSPFKPRMDAPVPRWMQAATRPDGNAPPVSYASNAMNQDDGSIPSQPPQSTDTRSASPPQAPAAPPPPIVTAPDTSSPEAFVSSVLPVARAYEARYGIPAEVLLAINAHETNWGAADAYFGIKGPGTSYDTHEYDENGNRQDINDSFRSYDSVNAAYDDFFNLVQHGPPSADGSQPERYAPIWAQYQQDGDWYKFIAGITAAGYATDPAWQDKIAAFAENEIRPRMPQEGSSHPTAMAMGGLATVDPKGTVTGHPGKKQKPAPVYGAAPPGDTATAMPGVLNPNATIRAINKPFNLNQLDAATQSFYGVKKPQPWKIAKGDPYRDPLDPVAPQYVNAAGQVQAPGKGSRYSTIPQFENMAYTDPMHWQSQAIRSLMDNPDELKAFMSRLQARGVLPESELAKYRAGLPQGQVPLWMRLGRAG